MDVEGFRNYLENVIKSESRSVSSRLSKAKKIENLLNINLDDIITDKKKLRKILLQLQTKHKESLISRPVLYSMNNALRTYYTFKTNETLPKYFSTHSSL